nr:YjbH domain-containing protein [Vibrio intestinalis]
MYKKFLSGLAILPLSTSALAQMTWQVSQTDFGGTGLMQMPSGRMAEEGEFNLGINYNEDYYHYSASIQLMSWLESTIRYTRVPDVLYNQNEAYSGDTIYTDKGIDLKLRLLNESYWLPETSIGVRDIGGTGLFDGEFIAATKRFGNLDLTLGIGWGYLGQRGNITNPFCSAKDSFCDRNGGLKDTGGSVDYDKWFKGPSAIFGGIEYQTPYEPLRVKIEYDGNDYSEDFPLGTPGNTMPQHTPWNFGLNYRINDWGDAKVSYQRGDTLTLGFNFYTNFNQLKAVWRDDAKPKLLTKQEKKDAENNWQNVMNELANNAGYKQAEISVDEDTLIVKATQTKYRDRDEALERAATILANNTSSNIKHFSIIEQQDGVELTQTDIAKSVYISSATYMSIDGNINDAFSETKPAGTTDGSILANNKEKLTYGLSPTLKQSLGGPESFYLFNFGINAASEYKLTDNIELSGSIYFNLFDNYDKYNYVENSPHIRNYSTPRVRTMFRAYVHDNPIRLNNLQLTWFEQPSTNIFTQVYGGYLETMFAGVGTEILYRQNNTNWAVGLDMNLISQRDPDSWFGVYEDDYFFYDEAACNSQVPSCQAYVLSKGTTGHVTGYYMPEWSLLQDTLFKVSFGQFLGGDVGTRVDFSKQFKSGVTVGAYATFTDLTAEEYGEGSYNKGFYVSIPFDVMTIKPSTSRANLAWQPITRDGGQMLSKKHQLFNKTDARSPWYQRPSSVE